MDLEVNKRASFDYETLESYEAGIQLLGHEVKSVQARHASVVGAFVIIRGGEAWLVNATVPPYQPKNTLPGYDPNRARKLLLHARELKELIGKSAQKGLTLIPLRLYTRNARIKLAFALARHKKNRDKREIIRKREDQRNIERTLRER